MMPSVPVAIERRWWQCAIGLLDMPIGLTLATRSVAGSTIRSENLLPCWWRLGSENGGGCWDIFTGGRQAAGQKEGAQYDYGDSGSITAYAFNDEKEAAIFH